MIGWSEPPGLDQRRFKLSRLLGGLVFKIFWRSIAKAWVQPLGDILQFDEPGVAIEFDIDQKAAVAARDVAFRQAVDGRYLVAGAHVAFPGIGHVRKDSTNYDWQSVNYD